MLRHAFATPWLLCLLLALPLLALLSFWNERRRRRALLILGSTRALAPALARRRRSRRLASCCLGPGLLLLALGMAGPQWGQDWSQSAAPGRDLVVVLDCSRSMLAENPSRLHRARLALIDLVKAASQQGGHRLALVLFAGRPRIVCPLTHDYNHFRQALEMIPDAPSDPDLAPTPLQASGTRIGLALHEALQTIDGPAQGVCDILLLSDGDDPAGDAEWLRGLAETREMGVPVFTVGIGDPREDSVVPPPQNNATLIPTRLKESVLREIAREGNGTYIAAQTRELPLGEVYLSMIASQPLREDAVDALPVYKQRYTWVLLPAFFLLAAGMALRRGEA